jgi:hypothetical protein
MKEKSVDIFICTGTDFLFSDKKKMNYVITFGRLSLSQGFAVTLLLLLVAAMSTSLSLLVSN